MRLDGKVLVSVGFLFPAWERPLSSSYQSRCEEVRVAPSCSLFQGHRQNAASWRVRVSSFQFASCFLLLPKETFSVGRSQLGPGLVGDTFPLKGLAGGGLCPAVPISGPGVGMVLPSASNSPTSGHPAGTQAPPKLALGDVRPWGSREVTFTGSLCVGEW